MGDLTKIFDFHEKYKPLVRFGKEIPGYYVSKEGEVYSTKTNKFMSRSVCTSKRTGRLEAVFFRAAIKKGFFEDYKHTRGNDRDTWNGAKVRRGHPVGTRRVDPRRGHQHPLATGAG